MKETKQHYSFIAISEKKPNTLIVSEGDSDDNAELIYTTIKAMSLDNLDKKYFVEDYRIGHRKRQEFMNGRMMREFHLIKGEDRDDPVDLEVLIETFRQIPEFVVKASIVPKWKKRYYAYGYKLLTENKFGIGYEYTSPKKFADVMIRVEINGKRAITEAAIEKYKPQKTFDNGWTLPEHEDSRLEHELAKKIGDKFIELYFQLKKENLEP